MDFLSALSTLEINFKKLWHENWINDRRYGDFAIFVDWFRFCRRLVHMSFIQLSRRLLEMNESMYRKLNICEDYEMNEAMMKKNVSRVWTHEWNWRWWKIALHIFHKWFQNLQRILNLFKQRKDAAQCSVEKGNFRFS